MSEERRETKEEQGLAPVPPQEELLIAIERYLAAGVRLGTRVSNAYLQRRGFVFSVRPDGL
ncbi:MAG: 30S ribosomal protein S2, partial [Vulcanisaeta sp.]